MEPLISPRSINLPAESSWSKMRVYHLSQNIYPSVGAKQRRQNNYTGPLEEKKKTPPKKNWPWMMSSGIYVTRVKNSGRIRSGVYRLGMTNMELSLSWIFRTWFDARCVTFPRDIFRSGKIHIYASGQGRIYLCIYLCSTLQKCLKEHPKERHILNILFVQS